MRHSLVSDCDCENCERARFEHKAVLVVLCGVVACSLLAWVFFVGLP